MSPLPQSLNMQHGTVKFKEKRYRLQESQGWGDSGSPPLGCFSGGKTLRQRCGPSRDLPGGPQFPHPDSRPLTETLPTTVRDEPGWARTAGGDILNGEIVFAKSSGAPTGVRCLQMQVQMIRDDYETARLLSRGERNLRSACQAQKGACRLTCGVISRRESIGTPRLPFLPTFFGSVSSVLLGQAPCLAAAPGLCPHPTKASRKSRPPSRQSAQPRARERSSVVPVGLHAPSPESSIGGQRDTRFHWPSRSHSQPVAMAAVNTS